MDIVTGLTAVWTGVRIVQGLTDLWGKWRTQRGREQGLIVQSRGEVQEIPSESGVLTVPHATSLYPTPEEPPVTIGGDFLLEESLDWLRGDEMILMLVFEEGYQALGEFYIFSFDFDGYAVNIWPGDYSFYTLILDPEAPTMLDAEILAVGYPDFGEIADPNPISVSGYGNIEMDMLFFDREMFHDVPRFLSDLGISGS